jgi:hypothetical protein
VKAFLGCGAADGRKKFIKKKIEKKGKKDKEAMSRLALLVLPNQTSRNGVKQTPTSGVRPKRRRIQKCVFL